MHSSGLMLQAKGCRHLCEACPKVIDLSDGNFNTRIQGCLPELQATAAELSLPKGLCLHIPCVVLLFTLDLEGRVAEGVRLAAVACEGRQLPWRSWPAPGPHSCTGPVDAPGMGSSLDGENQHLPTQELCLQLLDKGAAQVSIGQVSLLRIAHQSQLGRAVNWSLGDWA